MRERDTDGTLRLDVDQILIEDATGVMCALQFELLGVNECKVPLALMYVDHNVLQIDERNMDDHRYLQSFSAKYGLIHSRPGNGISHYVHMERFGVPGTILAGADSHTTMAGALGMLGIGLGGLDVALAMAGEGIVLGPQRVVSVRLENVLPAWVSAKDIVLELLRRTGTRGGTGSIFEFSGEAVAQLSLTERGTIANMVMETGASTAIFPSDMRTKEWLTEQGRGDQWSAIAADADAEYDDEVIIDLAELVPLIALPSSPANVVAVSDVSGTDVAQVCIGSSVNSSYEDLAVVAAILVGHVVSEECEVTATPGSRQILSTIASTGVYADLISAGIRLLEPVCGPCVGMGQAPPRGLASVRTFNRNFPGRSGTQDDRVYLCSPQTAAATALKGKITDPRTLGSAPSQRPRPRIVPIDDRHFIVPVPAPEARAKVTVRGPNIIDPPSPGPLPNNIDAPVLIVLPDDVSTGDMAPDGALAMAIWANIPECAKSAFRRFDESFYERAHAANGGIIVAGHNYGQGSSRESAAMVPLELGIRVIAAKSFARIHRTNLIANGIVPLVLTEEAYAGIVQGQRWHFDNLAKTIEGGFAAVLVATDPGSLSLNAEFSAHERALLLGGGSLRMFRSTSH